MNKPKYLITTFLGQVPHVIHIEDIPSLNRDILIYMDDILYKDSFYEKETTIPLKKFCSTDKRIYVIFKKSPKILESKRGCYKLTKEKYESMKAVLKADCYTSYDDNKLIIDGQELNEPKDVEEFMVKLKEGHKLFGTQFINNLVNERKMLVYEDSKLVVKDPFDCNCCGDKSEGYVQYLLKIKEMNANTYLAIHNYNVLDKVMMDTE